MRSQREVAAAVDARKRNMNIVKSMTSVVAGIGMLATTLAAPVAANNSQPAPEEPTIAAIVAGSGGDFDSDRDDYDILLTAVQTAGLAELLNDPGISVTVLAPNDRAFVETARELGFRGTSESGAWAFLVAALTELGDGDPVGPLTTVLQYHVIGDDLNYRDVRTGGERTTLAGAVISPAADRSIADADPDNIDPKLNFFRSNIDAANGTIHTINRVLLPLDLAQDASSIADIVAESGGAFDRNLADYDLLLASLDAAGLVDALDDGSAGLEDITVLAPNDLAFVMTARDLGYHGIDEAGAFDFIVGALTELGDGDPIPVLTAILTYHVLPGEQDFREVRTGGAAATLNGATIDVEPNRTLGDQAPSLTDARLLFPRSNIDATNGVIHTINRVMIPIAL